MISESYPAPQSWYERILYADDHIYRLNDELANDPLGWEVQRTLTHVYGCYFNDLVPLARLVGPDNIDWGYKTDDPEDEYFGHHVPKWADHSKLLTDASSDLVVYLCLEKPHFVFFMESDFYIFLQEPISRAEEIEIKLRTGLNLVDISDSVSLAGVYSDI